MTFHIRTAQSEDAELLSVLATQVWLHTYATSGITDEIARYVLSEYSPEHYIALLGDLSVFVLVAGNDKGNDKGMAGLAVVRLGVPCPTTANSSAELQTLYVQEHFIGRGMGKALLQAAELRAREQSDTALWLTVNAGNARAIAFYEHMGYSRVGTTHFVLGNGHHENYVFVGGDA